VWKERDGESAYCARYRLREKACERGRGIHDTGRGGMTITSVAVLAPMAPDPSLVTTWPDGLIERTSASAVMRGWRAPPPRRYNKRGHQRVRMIDASYRSPARHSSVIRTNTRNAAPGIVWCAMCVCADGSVTLCTHGQMALYALLCSCIYCA